MYTLTLVFLSVLIAFGISSNINEGYPEDETRSGVTDKTLFWPNGIVYYSVNRTTYQTSKFCLKDDYMKAIQAAIDDYHKYTCIKFVEKADNDSSIKYWVRVDDFSLTDPTTDPSCQAERVGFKNKENYRMNLENSKSYCGQGTIAHEFGHVLGLSHEHTREDRDYYIQIIEENISSPKQFIKDGLPGAFLQNGSTYGLPFNYASMMQYPPDFKSSNGKNTMATKNNLTNSVGDPSEKSWGRAVGITRGDQLLINKMYNCGDKYPAAEVQRNEHSDYCHKVNQSPSCKKKH